MSKVTRDMDQLLRRVSAKDEGRFVTLNGKEYDVGLAEPVCYRMALEGRKAAALEDGRVDDEGLPVLSNDDYLVAMDTLFRSLMGDDDYELWVSKNPVRFDHMLAVLVELFQVWYGKKVGEDIQSSDPKAG